MIKKIFIGLGAIILILVGLFIYGIMFPTSPEDSASISHNGIEASVNYSRPFKKGRILFGGEESLQPYGQYWRLGANAATELTVNQDFNFAGQTVPAGTYRMYAVPGPDNFEISLNSELGVFFAYEEPNYDLDVVKVKIPVQIQTPEIEQLTIDFAGDSLGVNMNVKWGDLFLSVPVSTI